MKLFSRFRVELRSLVLSKTVWLILVLCLCAPLLGYSPLFQSSAVESMSIQLIANPVLAGTMAGAVLWAVFTLMQASRPARSGMDVLTGAAASPVSLSAARMLSAAVFLTAVVCLCACLYLPYTAAKMEYLFDAPFYFANFFVFMLPTWWISVFFAEAFYQITCRVELAVLLYGACAGISFSGFASSDYFMRWLNPYVVSYSDGFLSYWPLRIGFYTRLIWLCIAAGLWLVSLLCIRKYQKNIALSFRYGMRRFYIPVTAVLCAAAGMGLWKNQPFIDHGSLEYVEEPDIALPQAPETKVKSIHYSVAAEPLSGKIRGIAEYEFKRPYTGEDMLELNPGYTITSMTYGGEPVAFRTVDKDVNGLRYTFYRLPEAEGKTLVIAYEGMPAIARFTADFMVTESVDTDYIQLNGAAIAPWTNYTCESGADIAVTIPEKLTPYLDYVPLTEFVDNKDGTKTWTASCGDFLMDFVAGRYVTDRVEAAGLQVDFVYGEAYREAVETYKIREAIAQVFEYGRKHYGALGMSADDRLLLMQKSIMVMGGHAYPGICEWFETVLSPLALGDLQRGASAQEVFIHEMLHQWWGAFGLECTVEDSWSDEGLTVYATYRLVKEKYGQLYARQYYADEWKKAVEKQDRNFYNRHPEYLSALPEFYQAQLRQINESTNLYMRMPLLILKAQELIGGEKNMDAVLRKMYRDREKFGYEQPFSYADFLNYCGLTADDLKL